MFQKLLLNHSSILCLFAIDKPCDESHRHLFSSCCDLSFVRTWLPCLIIIPCSVYLFHLDQKTLHDSIIRPSLRAVSESSLGAFLKASSSSRGGRQATLLNLQMAQSYLCQRCWNERAYNTWSRTSYQLDNNQERYVFLNQPLCSLNLFSKCSILVYKGS